MTTESSSNGTRSGTCMHPWTAIKLLRTSAFVWELLTSQSTAIQITDLRLNSHQIRVKILLGITEQSSTTRNLPSEFWLPTELPRICWSKTTFFSDTRLMIPQTLLSGSKTTVTEKMLSTGKISRDTSTASRSISLTNIRVTILTDLRVFSHWRTRTPSRKLFSLLSTTTKPTRWQLKEKSAANSMCHWLSNTPQ